MPPIHSGRRAVSIAAGGFHERLGQDGKPLVEPRRSRVNPRQAYCFAMAPSLGWRGDATALVKHGLDYWFARYRRAGWTVSHAGECRRFVARRSRAAVRPGFRIAGIQRLGGRRGARHARAPGARIARAGAQAHEARRAGLRVRRSALPCRCNPIRTCTCSRPRWRVARCARKANCGNHWRTKSPSWRSASSSIRPAVRCANSSTREWHPAAGIEGRIVEPGHQFEWAWLLLRWGGTKTRARRRGAQAHRGRRDARRAQRSRRQ